MAPGKSQGAYALTAAPTKRTYHAWKRAFPETLVVSLIKVKLHYQTFIKPVTAYVELWDAHRNAIVLQKGISGPMLCHIPSSHISVMHSL
jgi:hypothetical protein